MAYLLQINDRALHLAALDKPGKTLTESGCAYLGPRDIGMPHEATSQGKKHQATVIHFGLSAQHNLKHHPRRCYSRYWQNLSLEGLSQAELAQSQGLRHSADLVHQQLLSLAQQLEIPTEKGSCELHLAVPSYYSQEQLSLLLGVLQQTPFKAISLIDYALAQMHHVSIEHLLAQGQHWHISVQQHQTLLTQFTVANDQLVRSQVDVIPQLSWQALLDTWARAITDAFIQQTRFDPLHSGLTEQTLHNMLPQWLQEAETESELNLELNGKFAKISSDLFAQKAQKLYQPLLAKLAPFHDSQSKQFLDPWSQLPGLAAQLHQGLEVSDQAVWHMLKQHGEKLTHQDGALSYTTELALHTNETHSNTDSTDETDSMAGASAAVNTAPALYVLWQNKAYPAQHLGFYLQQQTLLLRNTHNTPNSHDAAPNLSPMAVIEQQDNHYYLRAYHDTCVLNKDLIEEPKIIQAGDQLMMPGCDQPLRIIEVARLNFISSDTPLVNQEAKE